MFWIGKLHEKAFTWCICTSSSSKLPLRTFDESWTENWEKAPDPKLPKLKWAVYIRSLQMIREYHKCWFCNECKHVLSMYVMLYGWAISICCWMIKICFLFYNAIANGGKLCRLIVVWVVPCKAGRGLNVLWAGLCIARLGLICQKMVLLI
jgi:hypothetical protein